MRLSSRFYGVKFWEECDPLWALINWLKENSPNFKTRVLTIAVSYREIEFTFDDGSLAIRKLDNFGRMLDW